MKTSDLRPSENVEDQRDPSAGDDGGGGPGFARQHGAKIGLGGLLLILGISYLTGTNPLQLLQAVQGGQPQTAPASTQQAPGGRAPDADAQFVTRILGSTEDIWTEQFQKSIATVVFGPCLSWVAVAVYVPHPFPSISWPVSQLCTDCV